MEVTKIPFRMDGHWAALMLLKLHFDNNYNGSDDYSKATIYSLSEILYTNELTQSEIDEVYFKYAENHDLGNEITLTGLPEQTIEVFSYLFELGRYKDIYWNNILKGNGYSHSVLDLTTKQEHATEMGGHWFTMFKLIEETYNEKFEKLTREEQDDFLLSNFKLIGESYRKEYYTDQVIQCFDKRY